MSNELNKPTVGGNHIPAKAEAIQSPPTNRKDLLFLNLFDMNKIQQKILGKFKGAWKTVANTAESFVDVPKAYFELLQAYKKVNKTEKALIDALIQQVNGDTLFEYEWNEELPNKTAWIPPKTNDMVENVKEINNNDEINWHITDKLKIILCLWNKDEYNVWEETNWYPTEKWYEFIKKNQQAINDCYDALYDFSTKAMNTKLTTYKAMNNAVMTYRVFLIATFFLGIGLGTYHLVSANDGTENTGLPTDSLDIEDTELIDADEQLSNVTIQHLTEPSLFEADLLDNDPIFSLDTNNNLVCNNCQEAFMERFNANVPTFAKQDIIQLQTKLSADPNMPLEDYQDNISNAMVQVAKEYDVDVRRGLGEGTYSSAEVNSAGQLIVTRNNGTISTFPAGSFDQTTDMDGNTRFLVSATGDKGDDALTIDIDTHTTNPDLQKFYKHYDGNPDTPVSEGIYTEPVAETTTTETTKTETPTEVEDPEARIYNYLDMTKAEWDELSPEEKEDFTFMAESSMKAKAELETQIAELKALKNRNAEKEAELQQLEAKLKALQNK